MNLDHKTICLNKRRILKWTDLLVLILKLKKVYCTAIFSVVVIKLSECISCKYTIIIFSVPKRKSENLSIMITCWHIMLTDYLAHTWNRLHSYQHIYTYRTLLCAYIGWTLDRKHLYQQWRVWRTSHARPKSNFLLTSSWVWNHLYLPING